MKYKDPTTGNFKEIRIRATDELPTGAIVDYDGLTTDIPLGWESYGNNQIKKVSETTPVVGNIINQDSNSTTDGYSCNYVNNTLENLTNVSLITEELVFNDVSTNEGGYFRIGNLIIINLKIVPTRTGLYFPVSGLPKARVHDTSLNIVNDTDGTANSYFAIVTNAGKLQINVPTASRTYSISGVYVCTD